MFRKLIQAFLRLCFRYKLFPYELVEQTAKVELLNIEETVEKRVIATDFRKEDQEQQAQDLSAQVSKDIQAPLKRGIEDPEANLKLRHRELTAQVSHEIAAPLKRQIDDLQYGNLALGKHLVKLDPRHAKMSSDSAQLSEEIVAPLKRHIEDLEDRNLSLRKHLAKLEDTNLALRKHLAKVDPRHGEMPPESAQVSEEIVAPLKRQVEDLEATNSTLAELELLRHWEMSSESGSTPGNSGRPTHVSDSLGKVSRSVGSFINKFEIFSKVINAKANYRNGVFRRPSSAPAVGLVAEVMNILFEGLKYETFIEEGMSICPDPVKRKAEYFALFLDFQNQRQGPGYRDNDQWDAQFFSYYKRMYFRVCRVLRIETFASANSLQGIQQHSDSLASAFRKAAQAVWNLYLLSFSFQPPASLVCDRRASLARERRVPKFEVNFLWIAAFKQLSPGRKVAKSFSINSQIYPVVEDFEHFSVVEKDFQHNSGAMEDVQVHTSRVEDIHNSGGIEDVQKQASSVEEVQVHTSAVEDICQESTGTKIRPDPVAEVGNH